MSVEKRRPVIERRVLQFIRENHLVSNQQKLVVAVSGGPDSVCLLRILVEFRKELAIELHVAHLNHQLRGAESDADARYVAGLAHHLGIPATIEKREVKTYQAQQHFSLEEAAREVRYIFLTQVARSIGADKVATGHTTDDHIETILMHLIRGSGSRGLRGLLPSSQWQSSGESLTIIRPLLSVSRQETATYCYQHRLKPHTDTSNMSLSPLRNRIRLQLLPLLQSYNPQIVAALLRTARTVGDDLAFLETEGARIWGEIVQKRENTIILDRERFLGLPPSLKRHLLRMSLEELLGSLKDIERRHIEEIMGALTKPAGKIICLPGGLHFSVEYCRYLLSTDMAALSPFPILKSEFLVKVPGETSLAGWNVEATIINREQMVEKDGFTAYFDLAKTGDKLVIRPRQRVDRFQPLGMSQPKKLGEFMIDARIPRSWRERIPIVCSPQHILWVVGWRIDDRVKVTEDTKKVLCLRFEQNRGV